MKPLATVATVQAFSSPSDIMLRMSLSADMCVMIRANSVVILWGRHFRGIRSFTRGSSEKNFLLYSTVDFYEKRWRKAIKQLSTFPLPHFSAETGKKSLRGHSVDWVIRQMSCSEITCLPAKTRSGWNGQWKPIKAHWKSICCAIHPSQKVMTVFQKVGWLLHSMVLSRKRSDHVWDLPKGVDRRCTCAMCGRAVFQRSEKWNRLWFRSRQMVSSRCRAGRCRRGRTSSGMWGKIKTCCANCIHTLHCIL